MKQVFCFFSVLVLLAGFHLSGNAGVAEAQVPTSVSPTAMQRGSGPGLDSFGVPFPRGGDAKAWAAWRAQVAALRNARRAGRAHKQDSGTTTGGGMISTVAGSAPFQAPITALQAGLSPGGIAVDATGNLYLSVPEFAAILKVDTASNVTVYAGKPLGTGPEGQSGDGGLATAATFELPEGLALDAAGDLYITDFYAATVRKIAAGTGIITTVAGMADQFGDTGDGGPATSAELEFPSSVAVDSQGNLYIGDAFDLRVVSATNGLISTLVGGAAQAQACVPSGTQTCAGNAMNVIIGGEASLVAGPNALYAGLNAATPNQTTIPEIVTVSYQTGIVQLVAGGGTSTSGTVIGPSAIGSTLHEFSSLVLDSAGDLDIGNSGAILQLAAGGTTLTTLAGTLNDYGYSGDGGPATSALFSSIGAMVISASGSILINDSNRVRSIDAGGMITTVAGDGTYNFYGDGGPAVQAGLYLPSDTAFDGQGNLYIADTGNNSIRKVDAVSGNTTSVLGNAEYQSGGTQSPYGEFFDITPEDATHLFVSTSSGVELLDLSTGNLSSVETQDISYGGQLAFDGNQTLYLGEGFQIVAINTATGVVSPVQGTRSENRLRQGVAIDGSGNLYYSAYCAVLSMNVSTVKSTLIAGSSGFSGCYHGGDGGLAVNAQLELPTYLRLDNAGHLLIAEAVGIRSVDLKTGIITTVAGSINIGFSGDGGNADAAVLHSPNSVTLDAAGNLYIADTQNDRIRRVMAQPSLTATLTASATNATAGTPITLTATYTGVVSGVAPTGAVTFLDGSTSLGTGTLTAGANGAYVATLTDSTLAVGMHTIVASYPGDMKYAAVAAGPLTLTVTAAPLVPSFTLTASASSVTFVQGTSGTALLTITPLNAFNQAVTFGCVGKALAGTTPGGAQAVSCSFNPATVTTSGTTPVTTTVTFSAPEGSAALAFPLGRPDAGPSDMVNGSRWWLGSGAAGLACLLMAGLPGARRRTRGIWIVMIGCVLLAGSGLGCGSNSGSGSSAPQSALYPVEVFAMAGSGANIVSESVTVNVTVTQ